MMDVYVITGNYDHEGSRVLGVATSMREAEALVIAFAQTHGMSITWHEPDEQGRGHMAEAWFSAPDGWSGPVASYDTLVIERCKLDSPLRLLWLNSND